MSIGFTKIYNGVNVVPQNVTTPSVAGDIRYNSSFGYFEVYVSAGLDTIVTSAATQTLTNKTLSGNTATNLINAAGTLTLNVTGNVTVPGVTDTLAAIAATQTLSNKTFSDAITLAQIATPSNPSAGFNKIYAKNDSNLYILTSAGAESKVGVGSVTSVGMSVPSFLSVTPSTITSSGTFAVTLSGTALPIANGGTGVTSVTTTPAASAFVGWDANKNINANAYIEGTATTATAAGTTTLTVASAQLQQFTGTTTQTVVMPDATTLLNGQSYTITNRSTGAVTVNKNGGALLQLMASGANGSQAVVTLINNGTAAGVWDVQYSNAGFVVGLQPTVQKFTSGSGTYTTPAGVQYIRVRMVGAGGGGSGSGVTFGAGSAGSGATTFGTSLLVANAGAGGNSASGGGAGGTATIAAPAIGTVLSGGQGQGALQSVAFASGGDGGATVFGGAGSGSVAGLTGGAAAANTGAGGGGAGAGGTTGSGGGGGGAGGFIDVIIPTLNSTYSYSIATGGGGGTAGSAGGSVGGVGAAGYIEVTEYYSNVSVGTSVAVAAVQPTVQKFLSGSGTYTPPTGVQYIKVRLLGAGGGGGGSGTGASGGTGGTGGNSTFGGATANGGVGGTGGGSFSNGATASLGTFSGFVAQGGSGTGGTINSSGAAVTGGNGGNSYNGGSGGGGNFATGIGGDAGTNSGSGGGGGGSGTGTVLQTGAGGSGGGYAEFIIPSPAVGGYSYAVGAAGTAGASGTSGFTGGAGGAGRIVVEEYYSNFSVNTTASVAANTVMAGPQSGAAAGPTFRSLVPADTTPSYYSGVDTGATWTSTSSTFIDPTVSGTNTLTKRQGNLTVATAASNLPGITFTPASASSVYRITASFQAFNDASAGNNVGVSMTDGTTQICTAGNQSSSISNGTGFITMDGIFVPGTASAVTVKLQVATGGSGTASIGQPNAGGGSKSIEWTVTQIG